MKVSSLNGVIMKRDGSLLTEQEADQLNEALLDFLTDRGMSFAGAIGWEDEDGSQGGWNRIEKDPTLPLDGRDDLDFTSYAIRPQ